MNHATRGWIGTGLLVGLFWVGRAGAQECEPDGGTGCKDGFCIPYTCSTAPVHRGFCESSLGSCPPGTPDGTPCGSGMTCRSQHEILAVESVDGGGFSCEALPSYCSLPSPDTGDGSVGATGGTEVIGAAGAADVAAAGGSSSVGASSPTGGSRSVDALSAGGSSATNGSGAGASSSADTHSSGGRSSEAEEPKDAGLGASSASKSDGSSCTVAKGRSGRFPPFGATAALLFVVTRRRRRAAAPPRS